MSKKWVHITSPHYNSQKSFAAHNNVLKEKQKNVEVRTFPHTSTSSDKPKERQMNLIEIFLFAYLVISLVCDSWQICMLYKAKQKMDN